MGGDGDVAEDEGVAIYDAHEERDRDEKSVAAGDDDELRRDRER